MPQKKIIVRKKTPFNDIHIVQENSTRELWFKDQQSYFLQTRLDLDQPNDIPMSYPQLMLAALLLKPKPKRVLLIGLGGGHLPRFMSRLYPETVLDNVEIDLHVVNLAKKYFLYEESPNCRTHVIDGRIFIQNQIGKSTYDIVWLDAFKSGSVPYHLKTKEFYGEIQKILELGGVVGSNLYGQSNKLKPHDRETLRQVFRYCYGFEDSKRIATIMLATDIEPQWTMDNFISSAKKMEAILPESMEDIATMHKPELLEEEIGKTFKDNFSKLQFEETVRKNNLNSNQIRPYPIVSLNLENEKK